MATDGITVISIGTNSGAAPLSVTVGVGGVPTGAHIFVVVADNGSTQGSVADPTLNSYLQAGAAFNTGIGINTFRSRTGNALTNGQTITYTPGNGTLASISAFYVLGLSPQGSDSSFNNTATGTSASPSVTSQGPPTLKAAEYEFIVGVVGGATLQSSFTQDSTNAAWTSPPGQVSLAAPVLGGGNVVLSSSASNLTYNPAFNSSDVWAASISAYAIQVFELESKPARFSPTQRYARFLYNNWSEQPPVAEDNQHFLARFRPAQQYAHVQYKAFRYNFNGCDISGPLGPQPDSNTHFVPPFTAVKTTRFAFNSLNTDAQPVAETNTHFLAQYRAPKYNVFLYGLDSREQPPVAEDNQHFLPTRFNQVRYNLIVPNVAVQSPQAVVIEESTWIGSFKPTVLTVNRRLFGTDKNSDTQLFETPNHFVGSFKSTQHFTQFRYNSWSEQPPVAETNQYFTGKFQGTRFPLATIVQNLYTNPTPDTSFVAPVVETNTNFIGKFAPVKYAVPLYNFNGCDVSGPLGPQPDSNTHFVPPFTAVRTTRFAFNSLNTDSSSAQPVAETNTHFLARFASAPQYRALRLESWRDDGQPVQETNTHFLAQYRAPKYNVFLYGLDSREQPPVAEAQPHFLGRFAQTRYSRFSYNYSGSDFPAVAESQPHFLGRFTQAKYSRFLYNGADISGFVPQVETNTHFLAKFTSAKNYSQFQYNLNTSEQPPVAEAQPHFLGRFQATKYSRFRFNGADISGFIPQPETNTNFIAAFKPAALKVNAALSQNTSYDVEIETNQHVLARYRSVSLTVSLPLRQNAPTSDVVAETNTQSIGRFQAAKLATPTGLRFHTNEDITVSAPETNVSTIGRFYRPQIALLASLWNNAATDQIALPNPHFIGKFAPTKYARFNYNSDSCEFPAVAETQPHFIGKFAPAQYGRFRFNDGFDVTGITSTQPETNVNFIGRFQPTNLHVTVFNGSDFNPPEPQVFYSKTRVRAVMTSYTSLV